MFLLGAGGRSGAFGEARMLRSRSVLCWWVAEDDDVESGVDVVAGERRSGDGAAVGEGDGADQAGRVGGVGVLVVDYVPERLEQVVEPALGAEPGRAGTPALLGVGVVVFGDVVEVGVPRWCVAAGPGAELIPGTDVRIERCTRPVGVRGLRRRQWGVGAVPEWADHRPRVGGEVADVGAGDDPDAGQESDAVDGAETDGLLAPRRSACVGVGNSVVRRHRFRCNRFRCNRFRCNGFRRRRLGGGRTR